jgi:hypothetical protein
MANDAVASTSPDYNANGGIAKLVDDLNQRQVLSADGAITIKSGMVAITKGSACAATLAAPTAGAVSAGGDDGKELVVRTTTAFAHTITTPANKINTNKLTATFGGALTDYQTLRAYNGVWYTIGSSGSTLS